METSDDDEQKGEAARKTPADYRRDRAAAQLRANLMRRKQQIRARRSGDEDDRAGALKAGPEEPDQSD